MNEKTIMITGANSGLGKAITLGLAQKGAKIIMICRNEGKCNLVKENIIKKSNNNNIHVLIADLSSQTQIRALVENFNRKYKKLDVLINNAGIIKKHRELSEDNIEMTFVVNYLAPFLLTNLLLNTLKNSAPSRIINVSSSEHEHYKLNMDDLQSEKNYSKFKAYGQSKIALILFTYELSRRLDGTGVSVNALHPGIISTNIGRELDFFSRLFIKILFKRPQKGAETPIYLATSDEVTDITGKYFKNKKMVKTSDQTYDADLARHLWTVSETLVGLNK